MDANGFVLSSPIATKRKPREYKGSGSNAQQASHKQSELTNAPNKAIRHCLTLIRPSGEVCAFLYAEKESIVIGS
jgi:hypothetical protein